MVFTLSIHDAKRITTQKEKFGVCKDNNGEQKNDFFCKKKVFVFLTHFFDKSQEKKNKNFPKNLCFAYIYNF